MLLDNGECYQTSQPQIADITFKTICFGGRETTDIDTLCKVTRITVADKGVLREADE